MSLSEVSIAAKSLAQWEKAFLSLADLLTVEFEKSLFQEPEDYANLTIFFFEESQFLSPSPSLPLCLPKKSIFKNRD